MSSLFFVNIYVGIVIREKMEYKLYIKLVIAISGNFSKVHRYSNCKKALILVKSKVYDCLKVLCVIFKNTISKEKAVCRMPLSYVVS